MSIGDIIALCLTGLMIIGIFLFEWNRFKNYYYICLNVMKILNLRIFGHRYGHGNLIGQVILLLEEKLLAQSVGIRIQLNILKRKDHSEKDI